jgi:hypothetical protein
MAKTPEEIQALKESWRHDPAWDIEDTEGFEAHHDELLAYRKEVEAEVERKSLERDARRLQKIAAELGPVGPEAALVLQTFEEIERELKAAEQDTGNATSAQLADFAIKQAGVRATLLLASQVMRIATSLEAIEDHVTFISDDEVEQRR